MICYDLPFLCLDVFLDDVLILLAVRLAAIRLEAVAPQETNIRAALKDKAKAIFSLFFLVYVGYASTSLVSLIIVMYSPCWWSPIV